MKILVTGANGYLGRGIVKSLLDDGVDVVATDFNLKHVDDRATKIECDLFSIKDPYAELGKPGVLLHLAWRDGFKHASKAHIEDFSKHCKFIDLFAQSEIKTISVMGSMHEVGKHEGAIDENTPCKPQNFYGIAKNALREVTQIMCRENEKTFLWLRGFYIVGNSREGSSIFAKIASAANQNQKVFPFTTGQNKCDFLNYDEFCDYVSKAVQQSSVDGIVNICSGNPEKLSERVERFIEDNKWDIKLEYGAFPERDYDSKEVWGNNTKLKMIVQQSLKSK